MDKQTNTDLTGSSELRGYDYGTNRVPKAPISLEELRELEQAVGWTDQDATWLKAASEFLVPQAEKMVDHWRSLIGEHPQLLQSFLKPDGTPDNDYRAAVKRRFVQWVSDICLRPHDQHWLNYQEEIGQRHTPARKNKTDSGHTPPVVPLRYLVGFSAVVITSIRRFLASSGRSENDLRQIEAAWTRAVMLSIALWSRPYSAPGLW